MEQAGGDSVRLDKQMRPTFDVPGRCRLLGIGLAALCLVSTIAPAQGFTPSEYQVKAAYLYDFSRFVEWPAHSGSEKDPTFAICVIGKDPFGAILDATLAGEKREGQNLEARRISKAQEALACRILFIGTSEADHLKEILAQMKKATVLTVSDIPRFSESGGMIEFVLKDHKVRFDVNLTNATDAGLAVSSDLLKVALTVRRNPAPGD